MKLQRTGLTEGSLLYNDWLKKFDLYRDDTESEFINWLYSTSGWYDRAIKGSYFDIDIGAVKKSSVYQRFLKEYRDSLLDSDWFHLMVHSSWHLRGLEKQTDFSSQFSKTNFCYWKDLPFLQEIIKDKKVLVIGSLAPLIAEKYGVLGYQTPTTHLNTGDDKNAWETLDKVTADIAKLEFDFALVSFGAYGCLLTDRIVKMGKSAATIGSGMYDLFPVERVSEEKRPTGWEKIENGRYWE